MKQRLALLLLIIGVFVHAQDSPKNFKGFIKNNKADSLIIESMRGKFRKALVIKKGHFEGFIQQGAGLFNVKVGNKLTTVFLSNETNLGITADATDLEGTITFDGDGAKENLIIRQMKKESETFSETTGNAKDTEELKTKAMQLTKKWDALINDAHFSFVSQNIIRVVFNSQKRSINSEIEAVENKMKFAGKPAPQFTYKDIKGDTVSLSAFKGKYVYIDVWATWCKPCMMEIPDLLALQKTLKDKNIAFISVSIDKPEDAAKWKKVVAEKHLDGTQLIAENAWDSSIVRDYKIESVPRFILIDPQGKIVDFDAKRPGDEELLNELNAWLK